MKISGKIWQVSFNTRAPQNVELESPAFIIAKKLLRRCLDILVERQICIVELDVEFIQRGAIRLYEKLGFNSWQAV